jgi:hypothetical protein
MSWQVVVDAARRRREKRRQERWVSNEVWRRAKHISYVKAEKHPLNWVVRFGIWSFFIGLAALAAQTLAWLGYGVWPPASPLAFWHYAHGNLPLASHDIN